MEILLNGKKYIVDSVSREPIQPFTPAYRTNTSTARSNVVLRDWYSLKPGVGIYGPRISHDNPPKMLFDSTADTRFTGAITPARLRVSVANSFDEKRIRATTLRGTSLYEWAESTYNSGAVNGLRLSLAPSSTSRTVAWSTLPEGARAFSAVTHGNRIIASGNDVGGTETSLSVYYWNPDDGAGVLAAGHKNGLPYSLTTTVTRRNNPEDYGGTLLSFGNTLIMCAYIYDNSTEAMSNTEVAGNIIIMRTTDAVASSGQWYVDGLVKSSSGVSSIVLWRNSEGKASPVFCTVDGVYAINLSASSAALTSTEKLLPLPHNMMNGRGMSVYNGDLIVPGGCGKVTRVSYTGSGFAVQDITPEYNVLSASSTMPFYGTSGVSDHIWYYMGFSSTETGNTSKVIAYDGTKWHYTGAAATSATEITAINLLTNSGGSTGLRWYEENGSNSFRIDNISLPPDSSVALSYETTAVLELPDFDGGLPEEPGVFLTGFANFDSTAGTVTAKYGVNGDVSTTATLGTHTIAAPTVSFGSGAGVSGRRIRLQLTLTGASATDTVKLREWVLAFLKIPATRMMYRVLIDVDASSRLLQRSRETIITDLDALLDTVPMVTFSYSQAASVYVKTMPPWVYREVTEEASGAGMGRPDARHGVIEVLLVELI